MNNKEIAMRIRELRKDRKLTQEEVAEVLGMTQSAYCDLESGATAFKAIHLDKLATFYDMSLDDLLRSDRLVVNMHDHASFGYIRNQTQNGGSEGLLKDLVGVLQGISEQQKTIIQLLSKRSSEDGSR